MGRMSWLVSLPRVYPADVYQHAMLGRIALLQNLCRDGPAALTSQSACTVRCCSPQLRESKTLQALKLIKHVSNKGAHDYRRAIVKQAKEIRWGCFKATMP